VAAGEAAEAIRERIGDLEPVVGLVLGSGLGSLGDEFAEAVRVPYGDLPHWPPVGVAGHSGVLVAGRLEGVPCLALKGRAHLYEGHDAGRSTLSVRALAHLGIRVLFVSNAAGAIHPDFGPGDLMLISDHLNLMGRNPLIGPVATGDERFPDMSDPYDGELRAVVREAASAEGIALREGVYAGLLGPSYETPAEIRMLRTLGADAVGMSTVPEVITARAIGVRCFGASCLTNYAAGISPEPLSHDEVMETTERVGEDFRRLVRASIGKLGPVLTGESSD
jgi:purine-nucleoside phosphorylase